jgi:very-short-patch-repair endonuclease
MAKLHPRQDPTLRGKLRTAARQMRHEATPAEDFLWQRLRNRQLAGNKFRRQYSIDRFIVDFYSPSAALIIEVDGEVHQQQVEADQEREETLNRLGYRVIRFTNAQVMEETDRVLQEIRDALNLSQTAVSEDTPSPFSGFDENGEGAGG